MEITEELVAEARSAAEANFEGHNPADGVRYLHQSGDEVLTLVRLKGEWHPEGLYGPDSSLRPAMERWEKLSEMNRRQLEIINRFQRGLEEMAVIADEMIHVLSIMGNTRAVRQFRERYEGVMRNVRGVGTEQEEASAAQGDEASSRGDKEDD